MASVYGMMQTHMTDKQRGVQHAWRVVVDVVILWLRPSAAAFLMPGQCDLHAQGLKGRTELQGPDGVGVLWFLQVGISQRFQIKFKKISF